MKTWVIGIIVVAVIGIIIGGYFLFFKGLFFKDERVGLGVVNFGGGSDESPEDNQSGINLCNDTDVNETYPDGKNYYQKGQVYLNGELSDTDSCVNISDKLKVLEYFCIETGIDMENYECPAGMICKEGACAKIGASEENNPAQNNTLTIIKDCGYVEYGEYNQSTNVSEKFSCISDSIRNCVLSQMKYEAEPSKNYVISVKEDKGSGCLLEYQLYGKRKIECEYTKSQIGLVNTLALRDNRQIFIELASQMSVMDSYFDGDMIDVVFDNPNTSDEEYVPCVVYILDT